MSLGTIRLQDRRAIMTPLGVVDALSRDHEAVTSGWVREALAEAALDIRTKDAEIISLKEQVASLQRVLAHRRDSDSVVDGPGEEDGPWASGRSQIPTPEGGMVYKWMQFPGVDG